MKEILIQFATLLLGIVCFCIQLIALIFVGAAWVLDFIGGTLSKGSLDVMSMAVKSTKEENSEETPT